MASTRSGVALAPAICWALLRSISGTAEEAKGVRLSGGAGGGGVTEVSTPAARRPRWAAPETALSKPACTMERAKVSRLERTPGFLIALNIASAAAVPPRWRFQR